VTRPPGLSPIPHPFFSIRWPNADINNMEEYHSELDFEIPEIDGQKSLMGERDNSVMFYNDIVVM